MAPVFRILIALLTGVIAHAASAAPIVLSGTIRDFCAPGIAGVCSQLSDFEGAVPGVVGNMTGTTLSGGLPTPGPNVVAGASSAANFAQWFVDTPGVNTSKAFSLAMNETSPGTYWYSNSSFFPIDGQLFGDQGRLHNYDFTLHLQGLLSFTDPTAVADSIFTFYGDDDLWVFVDGKRVIDLGGVHGVAGAAFSEETLKYLGLIAGRSYSLDIFFAERHVTESNFTIVTTFALAPSASAVPEPGALALVAAVAGAGVLVRRVRRRKS